MPLPHFSNQVSARSHEPVFQSQFECIFKSGLVSDADLKFLELSIIGIKENIITFNVNTHKITSTLIKIKDSFEITLNSTLKDGTITGIYEFSKCLFIDLEKKLINFNYNSDDYLRYEIEFRYEKMKFYGIDDLENYHRSKKLKNIIK